MKKILSSLLMLAVVAVGVGYGTSAFFSDTEDTDNNVFEAGTLDLQVDFLHNYYNGLADEPVVTTWEATDLIHGERFFDLHNVVPGDHGNGYISLHTENAAWAQVVINDLHNDENYCTEPESSVDTETGCGELGGGDLAQNLYFRFWVDVDQNGQFDGEPILTQGYASELTDPTEWDIPGGIEAGTTYLGYEWSVDEEVNNIIQSDSFTADVTFNIEQLRHNPTPSWLD